MQQLRQRLLSAQADNDRQGIDEQADLRLDGRQWCRTTGDGGAKNDCRLAAITLQQQRPGRLDQGVQGDFVLAGEGFQTLGGGRVEPLLELSVAAVPLCIVRQHRSHPRWSVHVLELSLPEALIGQRVLPGEPFDVVTIASWWVQHSSAVVALQHFGQQLRIAPTIHEDVVTGVNQLMALLVQAQHLQIQQWRPLQSKAVAPQRRCPSVDGCRLIRLFAPILVAERHLHGTLHPLQRLAQVSAGEERRAQDIVGIHAGLPGGAKALGVQAFDRDRELVDVLAFGLRIKAVKEHPLLHRRQGVEVLHAAWIKAQLIKTLLIETGQRHVGGGQCALAERATVFDQLSQRLRIGIGQLLQGRHVEHLRAELPVHQQFAAIDLAVEGDPVGQRRVVILLLPTRLRTRYEQAVGLIEAGIELTEVVEGNARWRKFGKRLTRGIAAKIAQGAVAHALIRHGAQLLLDLLDRLGQALGRSEFERVEAGEPAHTAGQVERLGQWFATMPFHQHRDGRVATPVSDDARQGGQQQVIDAGAIGRGRVLQQASGQLRIQTSLYMASITIEQARCGTLTGQLTRHLLGLPERQLALQRGAAGIGLHLLGPGFDRMGLGRQTWRLPGQLLLVRRLQVFKQNPPGHTVHRQVVDHQQQALAAIGQGRQQGTQQWPLL
ncbi:hypothetical protein D3C78_662570 [compost metagenome]